jgi:carboxymethylenebutenolidase
MCFDHDARPPIPPIAGGSLDARDLELQAADGNRLGGYLARAARPTGAAILILPDVRGLHPYYDELALRFAEHGVDALAIDYFGRTAGIGERGADFAYREHVDRTGFAGLRADITAGAERLRAETNPRAMFSIGFCFGGRLADLSSTMGLGLAGSIAFYGPPHKAVRDIPAPIDVAGAIGNPILGLFGGADPSIPPEAILDFDRALTAAGIEHTLTTFPDAPHSFFDRRAEEFAAASAASWDQVQAFIRAHSAA